MQMIKLERVREIYKSTKALPIILFLSRITKTDQESYEYQWKGFVGVWEKCKKNGK